VLGHWPPPANHEAVLVTLTLIAARMREMSYPPGILRVMGREVTWVR
jgi:hypothetical protein